jgi:hypothetical protein
MNVYARQDVPAGTLVALNVSGTAPPPRASAEQVPQGRDAQQGGGESAGVNIHAVPGRLDVLKWPLIGGFVCVFVFAAFLLSRKQVVAVAGVADTEEEAAPAKSKKTKASVVSSPAASTALPPAPSNGTSSLAEVDAAIGTSLDALKERLFRLELRRQAGTISEEEYAQERARAEKILRDLVRG